MSLWLDSKRTDRVAAADVRAMADQAFSRAAGAQLVPDNHVRLLRNASENYPAWLEAIRSAKRWVHFETYIFHDDDVGRTFADALVERARAGVRVRVLYDWMGALGKSSRRLWRQLREGGVEVRCYNPPRFDSPLAWISRDHRKMIAVDGEVGFVTGLCVGQMWAGIPEKNQEPWRDTGVAIRGPAVADVEHAFAQTWELAGDPLPSDEVVEREDLAKAGETSVRIVANVPSTAGLLRLDLLVASLARKRLWLTDAYYAGMSSYVQAIRAAARDGVDVRLLVPGATDIPLLRPLSRAGYRPLLDAGVRVFEWNGAMLHAKTAVADGRWSRVGSTNLNVASWMGNCELDAVIEDEVFARAMEEAYLEDLSNATEIVLDEKRAIRRPIVPPPSSREKDVPRHRRSRRGSMGRAAVGAVRIGNTVGAAIANRRVIEPVEARLATFAGLVLLGAAVLFAFFPRLLAYPALVVLVWFGIALLLRGTKLFRERGSPRDP